ncbi:U1 small nuclear ribonucleoprotein C-like [Curcuma longa]|uniref:U1 small nuclear ribonucleoprotein C-like n=1 Tax=Curcuma longa TaxID=136217 RepID=UPI003D9DF90C
MPRYYCDYCDTYLTHDSPSVRKQHNAGYKHKANVRSYYQQFEEQQTQSLIDQRIKEHLGQAAAFQVGATFNQHLMTMPGVRPPHPLLMPPILPLGASPQVPMTAPLLPGVRPPVLPPPIGAPGYGAVPTVAALPPTVVPPDAPTSAPTQPSSLPRPATLAPPISGAMTMPATGTSAPTLYQGNPSSSATTNFESFMKMD